MRLPAVFWKVAWMALLFSAALLCAGCGSDSLRLLYENFEVEQDASPAGLGGGEVDTDQERVGLEAAFNIAPLTELVIDGSRAAYDIDEGSASPNLDGYALGVGVRTPFPTEEGTGVAYSVRVGYHSMDDKTRDGFGGDLRDWELKGWEGHARTGVYQAFALGRSLLLAPEIGGLFVLQNSRLGLKENGANVDTLKLDVGSFGGYAGFKLTMPGARGLEASGNYYIGQDELRGFALSLGWRF